MAMSEKPDQSSEIESSQEENDISPIISQETYQTLESDLPPGNLHFEYYSDMDVPPEECDLTVCGSQTDRQEFTKITPQIKSDPESQNQVEQPTSSGMAPADSGGALSRFLNIEGPYKFGIHFNESREPIPKNAPWTYSPTLNKIFANFNLACPIQLHFQPQPPEGCVIRATPYFKEAQDANFVVERCLTHQRSREPSNIGFEDKVKHVIRCDAPGAQYEQHPGTGRLSVVAPCRRPETHLGLTTLNFYFTCFSSCTGGMNRRAIYVVYTLELGNQILGQRCFEVRICACPGRDRSKCEKKATKRMERHSQMTLQGLKRPVLFDVSSEEGGEMSPPPPKIARTCEDDDLCLVSTQFMVRGRQNQKIFQRILQSIKESATDLAPPPIREIKRESEEGE